MTKLISLFLYIFLIFTPIPDATAVAGTVKKGPYLIYTGDNTQITVLWQVDTTCIDSISWGTNQRYTLGSAASNEYGDDHQHRYIISDLTPGSKYYYQVKAGGNSYAGSFWTAPDTNATAVQFFAYGDTRTNTADHDRLAHMIESTYVNEENYQTFILSVGDLATDGTKESNWTDDLFNSQYVNIQTMFRNLPFQSCVGNHERKGELFKKYFPYPFVADRYWSYNYGPAHFVVLDQYAKYDSASAQYRWLENDLRSAEQPWKIIYFHAPGWSAGGHPNDTLVQKYVQPLCEKYDVRLVFAGHNHYYARAKVMTSAGDSVMHVTIGGGGAELYTPEPSGPNLVTSAGVNHYCKVNIQNESILEVEVISSTGQIVDKFKIGQKSR